MEDIRDAIREYLSVVDEQLRGEDIHKIEVAVWLCPGFPASVTSTPCARVIVSAKEVIVLLPRRAHNPLLIDAGLIGGTTPIPWWQGRSLRVEIV